MSLGQRVERLEKQAGDWLRILPGETEAKALKRWGKIIERERPPLEEILRALPDGLRERVIQRLQEHVLEASLTNE
jgi:hypothetical protein